MKIIKDKKKEILRLLAKEYIVYANNTTAFSRGVANGIHLAMTIIKENL